MITGSKADGNGKDGPSETEKERSKKCCSKGKGVDFDVLMNRVGASTKGAETIERGQAEGGGEIGVGAAAGRALSEGKVQDFESGDSGSVEKSS